MENGKTIHRMTSKIQEEDRILSDKLNQYVEREAGKLIHDISWLREIADKEIHLVRNDFKNWPVTWMIR